LLRLAGSGVTIEFNLFGQEASYYGLSDIDMPNDATRLGLSAPSSPTAISTAS
jgi:phosphotriesterase-related protein